MCGASYNRVQTLGSLSGIPLSEVEIADSNFVVCFNNPLSWKFKSHLSLDASLRPFKILSMFSALLSLSISQTSLYSSNHFHVFRRQRWSIFVAYFSEDEGITGQEQHQGKELSITCMGGQNRATLCPDSLVLNFFTALPKWAGSLHFQFSSVSK